MLCTRDKHTGRAYTQQHLECVRVTCSSSMAQSDACPYMRARNQIGRMHAEGRHDVSPEQVKAQISTACCTASTSNPCSST